MTAKQFKYRQWIAVLLIAVVVAGCSLFGPRIRIDGVTLDVALRANDDSPIAVDFVAVNDAGLLRQLSAMTATSGLPSAPSFSVITLSNCIRGEWNWFRGNSSSQVSSRCKANLRLACWRLPITARRGHTVCGWMISAGYG